MAIGKTASCMILAGVAMAAQFSVRHEHLKGGCSGVLTVDENGVTFEGPKKHAWSWKYQDIQQFKLAAGGISVVTYQDNKLALGADRRYQFTGKVPAGELYALLKDRLDQRFVAAVGGEVDLPSWTFPVKHLGRITGSEGKLAFGAESVVYSTGAKGDSRTWRYSDIDNISSSGPFQLTVTTFERDKSTFGDRRGFNFELKERITEATYNEMWMQVQKKNGKIQ
jgi:hypothetical protein